MIGASPRRRAFVGALALVAALSSAPAARAEIAYPVRMALPDWDLAVGLTGGVAFDENDERRGVGFLAGVDVGVLDNVWGLHLGLRTAREGAGQRVGGLVELTGWYVVMLGLGVRFGAMASDGGPDVPDSEIGATVLLAVPFPLFRVDEGRGGSFVLAPFARPGLRFLGDGEVAGYHEVGVMLRWTSFGW
jgi:hypothetical protein